MFDAVDETRPPLRPHLTNETRLEIPGHDPTCYLIHVASSPPDSAIRPSWNANPALDEITWASLPSELVKVCFPVHSSHIFISLVITEED